MTSLPMKESLIQSAKAACSSLSSVWTVPMSLSSFLAFLSACLVVLKPLDTSSAVKLSQSCKSIDVTR